MDNSKYLFNFQKELNKIDKDFKKQYTFKALQKCMENRKNLLELQKLIEWCSSRKVAVHFKDDSSKFVVDERIIIINKRKNVTGKLHTLLHECGHFLIEQAKEKNTRVYNVKFGNGYEFFDDSKKNKTVTHKIDVLSEEIEAWNRGYSLALRLNLNLDKESFDKDKASAIKTYAFWASH